VQLTIRILTDKGTGSSSKSSSSSSSSGSDGTNQDITEVAVLAAHAPSGAEALWSLDDFLERVAYMRELYHEFSCVGSETVNHKPHDKISGIFFVICALFQGHYNP
jgi:hypothetical protein